MKNMKKKVKARLKSLAQQRWEEFNHAERENHYSVASALNDLTAPFELSQTQSIAYDEMKGCLPDVYSRDVRRLKRLSQGLPFSEEELLKTLESLTPQKHINHFRDVVLLLRGISARYYPQFISELGIKRLHVLIYEYSLEANPFTSLVKRLSADQMKALLLALGDHIMLVCQHADEQALLNLVQSQSFNSNILIESISYNKHDIKTMTYLLRHLSTHDALIFLSALGEKVRGIVECTPAWVYKKWLQTKALTRTVELPLWEAPESACLLDSLRNNVLMLIKKNWLETNGLNLPSIPMDALDNELLKKINACGGKILFTLRDLSFYEHTNDVPPCLYTEIFIHEKSTRAHAECIVKNAESFLMIYASLLTYIETRKKEADYTTHTSVFGFFKTGWGVSQQDKLAAAHWFKAVLTGECVFSTNTYEQHLRALNQGRLGQIFNQDGVKMLTHPVGKPMINRATQTHG